MITFTYKYKGKKSLSQRVYKDIMKIKLSLDNQKFEVKPNKGTDAAKISLNIPKCNTEVTPQEFIAAISKGQSWSSLYTKPERKTKYWGGQQLFCVDLDSDPKLSEILNSINDKPSSISINDCLLGKPFIVHESFSSSKEYRKLRVIYLCNQLVIDGVLALAILRYLKSFWDGLGTHFTADPCTVELARILYGTNSNKQTVYSNISNSFEFDDLLLDEGFKNFIIDPRKNLSNNRQKSIVSLPETTDLSEKKHRNLVNIVWKDCLKNIVDANPSGYQALFSSGRRLSQLGLVSERWILNKILSLVSGLPDYQPENGYKHDPQSIVELAISWGSKYSYNYKNKDFKNEIKSE